jgi:hypothetical protein
VINLEQHSSELRSNEVRDGGYFNFGGKNLPFEGTSGAPPQPSRLAEGAPVQHDAPRGLEQATRQSAGTFQFAGRNLPLEGTSGPSQVMLRRAEGAPIRHDVSVTSRPGQPMSDSLAQSRGYGASSQPDLPNPASEGSGQLIGGPVRRA